MKKNILVASNQDPPGFFWPASFPDEWNVIHAALVKHQTDESHPYWQDALTRFESSGEKLDGAIVFDSSTPKNSEINAWAMGKRAILKHRKTALPSGTQATMDSISIVSDNPILASNILEGIHSDLTKLEEEKREELNQEIEGTETILLTNPSTSEGVAMGTYLQNHHPNAKIVVANLRHGKEDEYEQVRPHAIHRMIDYSRGYDGLENPTPRQMLEELLSGARQPRHQSSRGGRAQ